MTRGTRFTALNCAALLACGVPAVARGGNGLNPRTPVVWDPETACMTVVNRTVEPTLMLTYSIPYENLRPPDAVDEVADSRRHQFIAFCQDRSPHTFLQIWLSQADVDAAAAAGIVDVGEATPEQILETNTQWKDCFTRITADDERRLITFAEAAKPVVWDTTMLPVGPYVVSGYTWEPEFSIWRQRPGVVKVVDDPDPVKSPPAMAITNRNEIKYSDEILTVVGCLDAMDGSTITGYWALSTDDTPTELEWNSFGEDTPVSGDSFELPLTLPPESFGEELAIKVEITDPMDRRYTAHMAELASILPGSAGESGDCPDTGVNFLAPPGCEYGESSSNDASGGATGGTSTPTGGGVGDSTSADSTSAASASGSFTEGSSDGSGAPMQPGSDGGCGGCDLGRGELPALLVGPWLFWTLGLRRRRLRL